MFFYFYFYFSGSVSALDVKKIISKKRQIVTDLSKKRKSGAISFSERYLNAAFKVVEYVNIDNCVDPIIYTGTSSLCIFGFILF